jgi:hypothetical protein
MVVKASDVTVDVSLASDSQALVPKLGAVLEALNLLKSL